MTKVYLAGPMRGLPEFNFSSFDKAAARLRALGYEVFSPAENDRANGFDPTGMTGNEPVTVGPKLADDLDYVCRTADAIVVLDGWDTSPGVNAEIAAARALGKPVYTLETALRGVGEAVQWDQQPAAPATQGRYFEGGAYRDTETGKLDYEGFLSPAVLQKFAEYMNAHRVQSDGTLRPADNWQKGIPRDVYMKSMFRHFVDVWQAHRGLPTDATHLDALMALLFNVQGYAFELLREGAK